MKRKFLASITRILAILVVVIGLFWVILARPSYSSRINSPDDALKISSAALKKHVLMLSEELAPRNYKHPENLNNAADYIARSFRSSGASVTDQIFEVHRRPFRNVIAEFGPQGKDIVIVGAHYDAQGESPGADDNASGVAGLLELGRLLAQEKLRSRVVLAAFSLEEPPFFGTDSMGSAVFAKSLREKGTGVKLMIALEMIGYYSELRASQEYPAPLLSFFYPSTGDFVVIVDQVFSMQAQRMKQWMNQSIEVPVYSINAPSSVPGVDYSDHRNFWRYDYPAVMVTDTAFYRNVAYHTQYDTADRLDYEKMAQVVNGILGYVLQLDQGD